ncbi:MAG: hypothetical protein WCB46_10760 [Methanoregula sp.]
MVFTIIKRQDLSHAIGIIKKFHPNSRKYIFSYNKKFYQEIYDK